MQRCRSNGLRRGGRETGEAGEGGVGSGGDKATTLLFVTTGMRIGDTFGDRDDDLLPFANSR